LESFVIFDISNFNQNEDSEIPRLGIF